MIRFAILPGDGIGREVLEGPTALLRRLEFLGHIGLSGPWPVGGSAYMSLGAGLPEKTLAACEEAHAIFLGAVGEYPGFAAEGHRPEEALLSLREHFELHTSIRQIWRGNDPPLTVVRNLLGGAYGGAHTRQESDGSGPAIDRIMLTPSQIENVVEIALGYVREGGSLWSVDKANLLATSRLWRRVVDRVMGKGAHRGLSYRHLYVDRCALELVRDGLPDAVIVSEGIFGDILSDLAAARAGSIALSSSASVRLGEPVKGRCVGLFEPVHGSAPRMVGKQIANPTGAYLALVAALEWFPETAELAAPLRCALARALNETPRTQDLMPDGGSFATTNAFSRRVNGYFHDLLPPSPE